MPSRKSYLMDYCVDKYLLYYENGAKTIGYMCLQLNNPIVDLDIITNYFQNRKIHAYISNYFDIVKLKHLNFIKFVGIKHVKLKEIKNKFLNHLRGTNQFIIQPIVLKNSQLENAFFFFNPEIISNFNFLSFNADRRKKPFSLINLQNLEETFFFKYKIKSLDIKKNYLENIKNYLFSNGVMAYYTMSKSFFSKSKLHICMICISKDLGFAVKFLQFLKSFQKNPIYEKKVFSSKDFSKLVSKKKIKCFSKFPSESIFNMLNLLQGTKNGINKQMDPKKRFLIMEFKKKGFCLKILGPNLFKFRKDKIFYVYMQKKFNLKKIADICEKLCAKSKKREFVLMIVFYKDKYYRRLTRNTQINSVDNFFSFCFEKKEDIKNFISKI